MQPAVSQDLFESILRDFDTAGVLQDFILIGNWALQIYREHFDGDPQIPRVSTLDIDFLLPNPPRIRQPVDIGSILSKHALEEERSIDGKMAKFVGEEFEVEFLIPDKGRGIQGGYPVKELGIIAQPLRYLSFLVDTSETMRYKGMSVRVPEPATFVLMKYLLIIKRTGKYVSKIAKDVRTAEDLGFFLLENGMAERFRLRYREMPQKWQRDLMGILLKYESDLAGILTG